MHRRGRLLSAAGRSLPETSPTLALSSPQSSQPIAHLNSTLTLLRWNDILRYLSDTQSTANLEASMRTLAFCLLLITTLGAQQQNAKPKNDARYQAALQSYSDALKPGATRKTVEEYLQTKGVQYRKMCCISEKSTEAYLIEIGHEKHPWYCSEHNVYVALQFVSDEGGLASGRETDKLKNITIYHWLEGCV
jgi:hypothetical protein